MKCLHFNQTKILASHEYRCTHTCAHETKDYLTVWTDSFHSLTLSCFLFVNTSWVPSCSVSLYPRQWSVTSEPSDILGKYLILDPVLWNNGCISQGRRTAVTNIPKSPWRSTVTVCFSFASQAEDRARKIFWVRAGSGSPPFFPHCGTWLHLSRRSRKCHSILWPERKEEAKISY